MPTHLLDPTVCFLNHGSFGSTPRELLDLQQDFRRLMEREPVDFLVRERDSRWRSAVASVSSFLRSDPESTVFVHNATSGINAVIQSFPWDRGDQILTTNPRYDAVRRTLEHAMHRHGVDVVEAQVPFPLDSPEQVLDAIGAAVTPQTRMMVVDHIASPTAIIFPIDDVIRMARERGIAILVDGAHAPGHLDVDLQTNPPDFWVGNLHKWLCAPKGCAVLVVEKQWHHAVHPTAISHDYGTGLQAEFRWTGTLDPSAWMCAPAAIKLHQEQGGPAFRAAHHDLVQQGRRILADALEVSLPHPDDPLLYGAMATIPLPCDVDALEGLWMRLREHHKIEVPILSWNGRSFVRISGYAAYNAPAQYSRLASALRSELR